MVVQRSVPASRAVPRCHLAASRSHGWLICPGEHLRHSYATWLVSRGLPVNDVQRVMGHENAATTLGLYTHPSGRANERVRNAFADDLLIPEEW